MSLDVINYGTDPDDHTGETMRSAIVKCKNNFDKIQMLLPEVGDVDPEGVVFGSPGKNYYNKVSETDWKKVTGTETNTGWVLLG